MKGEARAEMRGYRRRKWRRLWPLGATVMIGGIALLDAACAVLVCAYNPEQDNVNGAPVADRWQNSAVTWELNPATGSNVTTSGGDTVQAAVTKSFSSWTGTQITGQTLNKLAVTQGPNTNLTDPDSKDCVNTISFVPSSSVSFPTGTIAFTDIATATAPSGGPPFSYTCTGGNQQCNLDACIADADIVFNPAENFSTTATPLANHFDVQSVATHEIGHLLGLDHSGISGAVMDPFGDTGSSQQRSPAIDDAIALAFLYPASGFATATGAISGTITQNGAGIFGSHVIAVDTASGVAAVDGLTDTKGNYSLVGLPPGNYNILAIPLSGVYDMSDFGGWYCGYSENSQPCCDPKTTPKCSATQAIANPINYTGKFH